MHLLIPYVYLKNHPDPALDEFTYGDCGERARKLKSDLNKGDFIFFHTSNGGKKYITAYYVVDRVLDTVAASQEQAIRAKYKNPHLLDCIAGKLPSNGSDDVVVFGDPIISYILDRPLLFDKNLANKLSLNIKFTANRTETQVIGSATRAWRQLTKEDVDILLQEITSERNRVFPQLPRTTEEVAETIEKDIEDYIASNPKLIGDNLKLSGRQIPIASGRIDLLFEDNKGNLIVVEVKLNRIGRDALRQIQGYISELKKGSNNKVSGVVVCSGVMPAYENDIRKQKDIKILIYGWELSSQSW